MAQLLKNNVSGVLSSQITAAATSMTLVDASLFPAPSGSDFYLLTLIGLNVNGNESSWEIVKVTAKSSNTLTIVRAQEGTSAAAWPAATVVQLRLTAGSVTTQTDLAAHTSSTANPHNVTKTQVGLGNVDNTSDASKPISTATQTALNAKQNVLVSGTNIKTINGAPVIGSGNVDVGGAVNGILKVNGSAIFSAAVAGTDFVAPGTATAFTAPQRPALSTETAPTSNALTWDLTTTSVMRVNFNANITTLTLTGTLSSYAGYQYQMVVRYSGGTSISWPSSVKFAGGTAPALTGTSGKVDIFNFVVASNDGGTTFFLLCSGYSQNL